MAIRVGINGFGRIGRLVFRAMLEKGGFDVLAVNDLADAKSLALLLKYDSVFGKFPGTVEVSDSKLIVNGKQTEVLGQKDPAALPWKKLGVDIVVESTGAFRKRADMEKHLQAGARKVILTAPGDDVDATIVLGVNDEMLKPDFKVVSAASCTTNCLAPMAKVLDDTFGIEKGFMTTIHAYTNDQRTADQIHKDPRRARAAGVNVIPTTTGAAKAIGEVIPSLSGKLDGMAMRVPVPDGSVTDLVVTVRKEATAQQVNEAMKGAAGGKMKGIVEYQTDPIVSSDVIGNTHSCVFDSALTNVIGGRLVKVVGWYDNEWAYSCRVAELVKMMAKSL